MASLKTSVLRQTAILMSRILRTSKSKVSAEVSPRRLVDPLLSEQITGRRERIKLGARARGRGSLSNLRQREILFHKREILRRACAFDGCQDSLIDQGPQIASTLAVGGLRQRTDYLFPVTCKTDRPEKNF